MLVRLGRIEEAKRTTLASAITGMPTGFIVADGWVRFVKPYVFDLYEMIPGVAAGLLATVLVSKISTPLPGAEEELDLVHERSSSVGIAGG